MQQDRSPIQIIVALLLLFAAPLPIRAATYFISPTGDDSQNGTSEATPWAGFVHANTVLQPGDSLILLDGIYNQRLRPTISGNETDGYITYRAKNDFKAVIAPETIDNDPYHGPAISIFSCPGCGGGYAQPVVHHVAFEGLIARAIGETSAISLVSADDAELDEMTHHIKVQKCGFYGSSQEQNVSVISLGNNLLDTLIEDVFAYGRSRKAGEAFGCRNVTIRRAVLRYDYWEGDEYKPNDPRTTFSGYNTQDSIFENMIALDAGITPAGYSASRGGFAASGNETPAPISGSVRNKYLGLIALNNPANGIEINGGTGTPNEDLEFTDIFIWNSSNEGDGLNVQGNDNGSKYTFITAGYNEGSGVRLDPYPHQPITNEIVSNNFSLYNGIQKFVQNNAQTSVYQNNSAIHNTYQNDIEASYAPDISSRLLDPVMVTGHERGQESSIAT